ncbi:MAG TPA: EAL domain-containing protein [Gammaproteobacteria bacterium]
MMNAPDAVPSFASTRLSGLPIPGFILSRTGDLVAANAALASLLRYDSVAQLVALCSARVEALYLHPMNSGSMLRRLQIGSGPINQESVFRDRHGEPVHVMICARRETLEEETVYEFFLHDTTAWHVREQHLLERENHYRLIAELAAEGVYMARNDELIWVSDGLAALVGMDRDALHGYPLRELIAEQSWPAVQIERRAQREQRNGVRFRASLLRQSDRRTLPVEIHERQARTPQGAVTIGIIRDLTKQLESEQSLAHDALHDPLTGLPNRKCFVERLRERMEPMPGRRTGSFAVLFIDLDNFKLVNDAHGHSVGDEFLRQIVKKLRAGLRDGDLLARHGGDEFTVLLDHVTSTEEAVIVTNRLQDQLTSTPVLDDPGVFASSSIGIVFDNPAYQTPEDMLRDADTAMYNAKSMGRAHFAVFDDAMLHAAQSRLVLDSEVRLAHDNGRFLNYYQPMFSRHGDCTGAEALIRWRHPQRGLLAPAQFIQALEESTVSLPVFRKVLADACSDLQRLRADRLVNADFMISVNVTARHLLSGTLIGDLDQHMERCSLARGDIVLEIVETALVQHPMIRTEIMKLKAAGHVLAVDDFGVGTSSLSVIRDLPVDIVKIDQSFVSAIEESERNARFLIKILEIANVLGVRTIAEGVETATQRDFLRASDCDQMQGFLLARPMSCENLEIFLRAHSSRVNGTFRSGEAGI